MIQTEWDYTKLAESYVNRPDYSPAAIDAMLRVAGVPSFGRVCDVGAGAAHLSFPLAQRGLSVFSVEPNDAMRQRGMERTTKQSNVNWFEGTGEHTRQPDSTFDFVTFGSSFNVCDRPAALKETARILKEGCWFACLWNHRNLADPVQSALEQIIVKHLGSYDYGTRREDQTAIINASHLFGPVCRMEADVIHEQSVEDCITAWKSHGTLQRQARDRFPKVIDAIERFLHGLATTTLKIPYTTRIWMAALKTSGGN